MTKLTTVSVKIPARILEKIPAPGNGRSRFIVNAIEEKIARRKPASGKPKTARGRRLAVLLDQGRTERMPLLSNEQIEQDLAERRGRRF
jgi:metal-responsive CopG/Arc/MetJ family transcriptional regulator